MILDRLQTFSYYQNLAQVAGAYDSDILDYGILSGIPSNANGGGARDMGVGDDPALKLLVQVTTPFAGGTSLQVTLKGAVDDGAGNPAAFSTWWASPAIALAALTPAGVRLLDMDFPRPPAGVAVPRFVKLTYDIIGTMTAGIVYAGVVLDRMDQMYNGTSNAVMGGYPPGLNVPN